MKRRLVMVLMVAAAGGILGGMLVAAISTRLFQGYKPAIEIVDGRALPDFTLIDQNGKPFTLSSLEGKAIIIYFGYTHCPDICPLVMSKFKQTIERLGPDADRVAFIFVTVDPERDTPEALKKYISHYHDRIVGLSGSPEQVYAVLKLYDIYPAKIPLDNGGYAVEHFGLVIGADRNHVIRLAFTAEMDAEEYVQGVKWLLSR